MVMTRETMRRPVGRPRKGPTYTAKLVVCMTPEQMALVKALVEEDGTSLQPSTYARRLLLARAAEVLGHEEAAARAT